MNGFAWRAGGLLLVAGLALPLGGSAAHRDADASVPELRRDGRLLKPVTVQLAFVTLHEALEQVGKAAGVRLLSTEPLAGENVIVLVRDRPAAEVLEVLAQTLGYRWRAEGEADGEKTYRLYQDQKSVRRELQQREERRRQALAFVVRECERLHASYTRPDPTLLKRAANLEAKLRGGEVSPEDARKLASRIQNLRADAHVPSGFAANMGVFLGLVPQIQDHLLRGEAVRLSSVPVQGLGPLPPWAVARIWNDERGASGVPPRPGLATLRRLPDVRFNCQLRWQGRRVALHLRYLRPAMPAGNPGPEQFGVNYQFGPPPADEAPGVPETALADPRLKAKVAVALPPKRPRCADPLSFQQEPTRAELLIALHRQQPQVGFVGDSYLRGIKLTVRTPAPLSEVLTEATAADGSSWRWDAHGYVSVRSLMPGEDRPGSIPAPILRTLCQRGEEHRGLRLEDYAWLAQQLRDEQIDWTLPNSQAARLVPSGALREWVVNRGRHMLRLLGSLSQQQLTECNGRILWVRQLSPAQRKIVQEMLRWGHGRYGSGEVPDPITAWNVAEILPLGLQLGNRPTDDPDLGALGADLTLTCYGPDGRTVVTRYEYSL